MTLTTCFPSPLCPGLVRYKVWVQGTSTFGVKVNLVDKDGRSVATSSEQAGVLKVAVVKLWWPYLMHESPGYLYSLEVGGQAKTTQPAQVHKQRPLVGLDVFKAIKRRKRSWPKTEAV